MTTSTPNRERMMIKLGKRLKLTHSESSAFRAMTGSQQPPRTVEDHDATLESAAEAWREAEDSPASRLLQAVLLAERIGEE
jgi:hypothetical protein